MTRHYPHSPSAAKRHKACPGSMYLPQEDPQGTEFADEGTLAHESLYDWCVHGIEPEDDDLRGHLEPLWRHTQRLAAQEPMEQRFEVTIESLYHGDWGGTPDVATLSECGTVAWIDDLKYGEGVAVPADENDQLLSYAGLCLETWPHVETFFLSIWQPRVEGPENDTFEAPVERVREWVREYFARVSPENAEVYAAGDHCRWCRAKSICPELYARAQEMATADFSSASADIEGEAKLIDRWLYLLSIESPVRAAIESARGRLLEIIRGGGRVPGYKAVRRLGNRAWSMSDAEVLAAFEAEGIGKEVITELRLASPAQAEKKTKLKKLVERMVHRPELGVALAPASAKGEEVTFTSPEQDFVS